MLSVKTRHLDVRKEPSDRLAQLRHELDHEMRQLRESVHRLGPSASRDEAIARCQTLIDAVESELADRRRHHERDAERST